MKFTIKDVETFSGIKAHTLRTWEIRYHFPIPERIGANKRLYSSADVFRIMCFSLLLKNGERISSLIPISNHGIEKRIALIKDQGAKQEYYVIQLFKSMNELNIEEFELLLNQSSSLWTADDVVTRVIIPFLRLTNLIWEGKRLTQEHLVVTIIRKKLLSLIEKIPPKWDSQSVLLFLVDNKQLDLGLLCAYYHFRVHGLQVIYMGSDVTIENLTAVLRQFSPEWAYTYSSAVKTKNILQLEDTFKLASPKTICLMTNPAQYDWSDHSKKILSLDLEGAISHILQHGKLIAPISGGDSTSA